MTDDYVISRPEGYCIVSARTKLIQKALRCAYHSLLDIMKKNCPLGTPRVSGHTKNNLNYSGCRPKCSHIWI